MDYFSFNSDFWFSASRPRCAMLGVTLGKVNYVKCGRNVLAYRKYMCQMFNKGHSRHIPVQPSLPRTQSMSRLVTMNVTTVDQEGTQWWPVTCTNGHVTHAFLACDVATLCLAGPDVTFSFSHTSWALPTSQSCPAHLAMSSLPPSFPCRTGEQRVPYSLVCDHQSHCLDGSDELFCTFPKCDRHTQYRCRNKQVGFFFFLGLYLMTHGKNQLDVLRLIPWHFQEQ